MSKFHFNSMSIVINVDECVGCGACETECPVHALQVVDGKSTLVGKCDLLGKCIDVCPVGALSMPQK